MIILKFRKIEQKHWKITALLAGKTFLAGMRPSVTLQLVASSETLRAVIPVANKRLVPGVTAKVSAKMRRLTVGLVANVTYVIAALFTPTKI